MDVRMPKISGSARRGADRQRARAVKVHRAGKANLQITRSLVISRATAKVHGEHTILIRKLGAFDRTQVAVRAVELELAELKRPPQQDKSFRAYPKGLTLRTGWRHRTRLPKFPPTITMR
jgi:hypothetical protein